MIDHTNILKVLFLVLGILYNRVHISSDEIFSKLLKKPIPVIFMEKYRQLAELENYTLFCFSKKILLFFLKENHHGFHIN